MFASHATAQEIEHARVILVLIAATILVFWRVALRVLLPAIVLGTGMQYNVAEVVDPLVQVVAKVRKDVLVGLK